MDIKTGIFIVTLLVDCAVKSKKEMIGEYASYTPVFNTGNYSLGNKLTLKKDSSFNYEGCGQIVSGKWSLIKDSLVLFCTEFNYKNKELNQSTAHRCNETIPYECFKIEDDGDLESSYKYKNRIIKNHLRKIKDF